MLTLPSRTPSIALTHPTADRTMACIIVRTMLIFIFRTRFVIQGLRVLHVDQRSVSCGVAYMEWIAVRNGCNSSV